MNITLTTKIADAGSIYKKYAPRLEKLGIFTFEDFLYHTPSRYDDFSQITKIGEAENGKAVSIRGTVLSMTNTYTRSRMVIQKAVVTDGTGTVDVTWFNQPFLTRQIKTNDIISLAGTIEQTGVKRTMLSPEFEILVNEEQDTIHTTGLVPVYHTTQGISSKWVRRQVHMLLKDFFFHHSEELKATSESTAQQDSGHHSSPETAQTRATILHDHLPESVRQQYNFIDLQSALQKIHFPNDYEEIGKAKERLAFDELFLLQLQSLHRRHIWKESIQTQALSIDQKKIDQLVGALPFQLTDAQKRAVTTIFQDLQQTKPMNRLLQGDVGSGKTIVATIAMYIAVLNNKQAVLMAPTEILAEQHYKSIKNLLDPLGVKIELVTGSTKRIKNTKSRIKEKTKQTSHNSSFIIHHSNVLIGTHALLYSKADFSNAGLVVIDEQQRFGVEQRAIIREKGNNPHILTMTATPIPRTMALTVYGDLDVSYLDQMPQGRKYIKTWLVPPEKREGAYEWMQKQITETDSQAFIICPFIEESENMQTIKAAKVEYERLQKDIFPNLRLGLLHGKMKAKEKDDVLVEFKDKKYDILVATPVVEVGIDIRNATIILIEASERFGLSQLHQLRGRVGRGDKQSYCLLFTESQNSETITRLKAMETLHEGAKLAELDLKLRGSGDLYGTMQSGYRMLKIASFSDVHLIEKARASARNVYNKIDEFPDLKNLIIEKTKKKISQD